MPLTIMILGNGETRNWDWVFNNWLTQHKKVNGNGHGRSGTFPDDSRSASRAAARLAEKAERGEFQFSPRPSYCLKRAAMLFGCYRKNDERPAIYYAAVAAGPMNTREKLLILLPILDLDYHPTQIQGF